MTNNPTRVYDLFPGLIQLRRLMPLSSFPASLTNVNGVLYFTTDGGVRGGALWSILPTDDPVLVQEITPGSGILGNLAPASELVNVNGALYFVAPIGDTGHEVWRSDGTSAGTRLLKDIRLDDDNNFLAPQLLTNVNGALYFAANDGVRGWSLWRSDGTEEGTRLVKDIIINPLVTDNFVPPLRDLTDVNGTLYFAADDGVTGWELWRSDGTEAGTRLVKDIQPNTSPYSYRNGSHPENLTNVNGTLYFTTQNSDSTGLWRSNGTAANTVLIKDVAANHFTHVNGITYFVGGNTTEGIGLWRTNGTTAGTQLVKNLHIDTGSGFDDPFKMVNINGTLFFRASDGIHGQELWKSDGTTAGTVMVKDIAVLSEAHPVNQSPMEDSSPSWLTNVGGTLYFSAYDNLHGQELWKSDGTTAGTVLVEDIWPGTLRNGITETGAVNSSSPTQLTNVGGRLYFVANDGVQGRELRSLIPTPKPIPQIRLTLGGTPDSIVNRVDIGENHWWRGFALFRDKGVGELSVRYQISGNASNGTDYETFNATGDGIQLTPLTGVVTFRPGEVFASIPILPFQDSLIEASETVTITLIDGDQYDPDMSARSATMVIHDRPIPVDGTNRNDTITGTSASERIFGLEGNDRLRGEVGDDLLVGGPGNDTLTGGHGVDRFVFERLDDRTDFITDFIVGQDQFDLRSLFRKIGYGGNDPIADGYMRMVRPNNRSVQLQIDPDGAGPELFTALVTVQNNAQNSALARNSFDSIRSSFVTGFQYFDYVE